MLKAVARQRMIAAGQDELDFGDGQPRRRALAILASRAEHLWNALSAGFDQLGFEAASDGDEVFKQLVLGRLVEPTSKLDTLRVLAEVGLRPPGYATVKRRLPVYSKQAWRRRLAAACARHVGLGPTTLVLYDVSTLYFETDQGDGFRESGFSKERRLEPQITIGLLTDARGFPLMVEAFEGNRAETTTIIPSIQAFQAAHQLPEVTVVADAGMLSDGNLRALSGAGLRFIVGQKIPDVPYVVRHWMDTHPGEQPPDGLILTQPWARGPAGQQVKETIYYQYRADRARRTLRGIGEQVGKAERAVAGKAPVKRNRFITLTGAQKSVNRELEAKARTLAGWKGYITNLATPTPEYVIGAYHQLWQVEKSFRMSKSDLKARPVYHHLKDSIEAHLTIVFAALAIARDLQARSGSSLQRIIRGLRPLQHVTIRIAGGQQLHAEPTIPNDVAAMLTRLGH